MREEYCQSCGMPLLTENQQGTEKDGSLSSDYCVYCYKNGEFLQQSTMEQMIEHCSQFADQVVLDSGEKMTKEAYVKMMREYFPHLKRWRK